MRDLKDRVVLLTGASRGIGVPLAVALGRRGARLVLTARDAAGLHATAELARGVGATAVVVPGDITDPAHLAILLTVARDTGPLEGVVHNAGIETTMAFADQTPDEITRQIEVNLTAPLRLSRAALPDLLTAKRGFLAFMSSMSGKSPTPYNAVYTATKHGLVGFVASLRVELADTGVHAGVICPSFVDEAGMFFDQGIAAPAAMRAVPLQRVVDATLRVIDGSAEELVTPTPVRPLLAIAQLFPGLVAPMLSMLGVLPVLRARAEVAAQRRR